MASRCLARCTPRGLGQSSKVPHANASTLRASRWRSTGPVCTFQIPHGRFTIPRACHATPFRKFSTFHHPQFQRSKYAMGVESTPVWSGGWQRLQAGPTWTRICRQPQAIRSVTFSAPCCHGGHSHAHDDSEEGRRITLIGTAVNIGLIAGKGTAGILGNSAALLADAGHSFSDLLSDVVTLGTLRIASQPPDKDHPYGHGKFEAIGSLGVGGLLCGTGITIGSHSISMLQIAAGFDFLVDGAVEHLPEVTALAAAAAVVSILSKELLFRKTQEVGLKINSPVVVANAHHHRSDALSSVVALGGICGSMAGFPLLDPCAGTVVSLMIIKAGTDIAWNAGKQLVDTQADPRLMNSVRRELSAMEPLGVRSWSHLRARWSGSVALIDLHIVVDPTSTVSAAHTIAERVRSILIAKVDHVGDVSVHVDAEAESEDLDPNFVRAGDAILHREVNPELIKSKAADSAGEVEGVVAVHHTAVDVLTTGVVVSVTIEVDPELKVRDAYEISRKTRRKVEDMPHVDRADIHLELFDS